MTNADVRGRWPLVVVALLVVQGALFAGYSLLDTSRAPPAEPLAFQRLTRPAPLLTLSRGPGTAPIPASLDDGNTLLHVWATWCEPCREELPRLLALDEEQAGARVVALSVDESWSVVTHFFEGEPPRQVWRAPFDDVKRALDVTTLPVTFVVSRGQIVARLDGAKPWSNEATRALVDEVGSQGP